RAAVRRELGVPADALLAVSVGRLDPQKDQAGFLRAAAAVPAGTRFVLCGPGVDRDPVLRREAGRVALLGGRADVERLWAAADIAVSSSLGEGFPNAVAEAMAAGVPCAATDAGDTRD